MASPSLPLRNLSRVTACAVALSAAVSSPVPAADPKPVPVGAGSYAEFPPPGVGMQGNRDVVAEVLNKPLFLDDSAAGKPVPTNQWWTDLLVHAFGGTLWAQPLAVQAKPGGCDIYFPNRWNAEGRDMVLESPLEVRGVVTPMTNAAGQPPADIVLADFEGDHYPTGWQTTGTAFGNGPTKGSLPGQTAIHGFMGKGLANSMLPNDAAKGTLTSPNFTLQRRYIHFLIAGGKRPDQLRCKLLTDGGKTIARTATGDNSETLKWQTWDVGDLRGKPAAIELEDNAEGGWAHLLVDQITESDSPTPPAVDASGDPNRFAAADARILRWGDWTVAFRLRQDAARRIDVTVGHGLPFVWLEYHGATPLLHVGTDAVCTGAGDSLAVEIGGRCFGVYVPDGATFARQGENLRVNFAAGRADGWLVVAALPTKGDLARFHEYAFAVPRDSCLSWEYDLEKGEVRTHWKLDTEPLKGTNHATLQAWAPHHYREGKPLMALSGPEYPVTARGILKCAAGNEFEIDYLFAGLLPEMPYPQAPAPTLNLPASGPSGDKTPNKFDDGRMRGYLAEYAKKDKYGNDTYWGGKDVLCMARYLTMAHNAGDDTDAAALHDNLHRALVDWFTYTPGETAHFFARYPRWKALVGFSPSYGSEGFNDQHFHYGYFTTAAALLGMRDAAFLKDYGPMARLVAKEYANWDRADTDFPYLRTFDAWEGHSWAGGTGSAGGENQESSSEAVQSWGGVFLLGAALNDDPMTAAGAMGYALETAAAREYWFDYSGHKLGPAASTFSPAYGHGITGILGGGGRAFATYFSGDPAWIYGIQWLPASPFMNYLGQDRNFAKWQLQSMWAERTKHLERENARRADNGKGAESNDLASMGALGTVILGFAAEADPDWAVARMDELFAAHAAAMTTDDMRGVVYHLAHALRILGPQRTDAHTNIPTSGVFREPHTGKWTAVVYNPKSTSVNAVIYREGKPLATIPVGPGALVSAPLPEEPR